MSRSHPAAPYGLLRLAVATPQLRLADVAYNTDALATTIGRLAAENVRLAVFPELALTGYSCADLLHQRDLLEAAENALPTLARATAESGMAIALGLPLLRDGRLYNCAALIASGSIVGLVPKQHLPTTREYQEERWFSRPTTAPFRDIRLQGQTIPFGDDLLFQVENIPDCTLGLEICEDLWATHPPSSDLALAGATVLLNPSASNETLGKAEYRRDLVRQQSARCLAAYAYTSSGPGESTTDLVYSGHGLICENGHLLAESPRFRLEGTHSLADIDLEALSHERLSNSSFSASAPRRTYRRLSLTIAANTRHHRNWTPQRPLCRQPFVPSDPSRRDAHCQEILDIQTTALAARLRHLRPSTLVLGLSGGLDSTLALLVAAHTQDLLKQPRRNILAITMPGFGTTTRTHSNAEQLAQALSVTLRTIPIHDSVHQHFKDIGHDPNTHDLTYENAQARERTQILMDLANKHQGLVLGTGDLSELALGWCTYNGDHMSMYAVNAGIPKTLIRHLILWYAQTHCPQPTADILQDIANTPISPELLPPDPSGAITQHTETALGPYVLHDFFLHAMLRHGFGPRKILMLATHAFAGEYAAPEIRRVLEIFYRRFFSQQYKRSAMPDGPKVGSVSLSPRGDWRMPSDAQATLWLDELHQIC